MNKMARATESSAVRNSRIVVSLDLDATLFEYGQLRLDATTAALQGMVPNPEATSEALAALLRQPLADLLAGLGFQDLRKGWDSPEVLILGRLLEEPASRETLFSLSVLAQAGSSSEEDVSLARRIRSFRLASERRNTPEVSRLLERVLDIREKDASVLAQQSAVFHQYVQKNAALAPGARELIAQLKEMGAEVHVVSEGNSAIQKFKFEVLGLASLAASCIVTDATCGVFPVLDELFLLHRETSVEQVPQFLVALYEQLASYTIKSCAFYAKLLHAIRDSSPENLQQHMSTPRFLTWEEWQNEPGYCLAMIGDRYRKDIEPLLQLSSTGIYSFRILAGRHSAEDPLDEVIQAGRPAPTGVVPDLASLACPLISALSEAQEQVQRPIPVLPSPACIQATLESCPSLSPASRAVLAAFQSESLRHQEVSHAIKH